MGGGTRASQAKASPCGGRQGPCCAVSLAVVRALSSCVLHQPAVLSLFFFFFDSQVSLFESIKPLFANKQLLVIANKTDVAPFADIK